MNDLSPPPIGHNQGPLFDPALLDLARNAVTDFNEAATDWLNLKDLTSEEQSMQLTDFVGGARIAFKKIDAARKEAKKPYDEAAKVVQDAFTPLLKIIEDVVEQVKPIQARWMAKQAEAERQRKAAERAEAEAKRQEAEKAFREAQAANNVAAQVEAQRLAKEAEDQAKAAGLPVTAKAGSATGAGRAMSLREVRNVTIDNPLKVFLRYRDNPDVLEALHRAAQAEVRAAGWPKDGRIEGATITVTQVAV